MRGRRSSWRPRTTAWPSCAPRSSYHRRLVGDSLLAKGVVVRHIMPSGDLHTPTFTSGARISEQAVIDPPAGSGRDRPLFE
jgi:hypothetical protein